MIMSSSRFVVRLTTVQTLCSLTKSSSRAPPSREDRCYTPRHAPTGKTLHVITTTSKSQPPDQNHHCPCLCDAQNTLTNNRHLRCNITEASIFSASAPPIVSNEDVPMPMPDKKSHNLPSTPNSHETSGVRTMLLYGEQERARKRSQNKISIWTHNLHEMRSSRPFAEKRFQTM